MSSLKAKKICYGPNHLLSISIYNHNYRKKLNVSVWDANGSRKSFRQGLIFSIIFINYIYNYIYVIDNRTYITYLFKMEWWCHSKNIKILRSRLQHQYWKKANFSIFRYHLLNSSESGIFLTAIQIVIAVVKFIFHKSEIFNIVLIFNSAIF